MSTKPTHPQERTAREMLTQQGTYIGTDTHGAAHFWDSYEQAVAVIGDDAERFDLADTPLDTLGQWCQYVRDQRGWADEPNVGGSLVGDLVRAVEA